MNQKPGFVSPQYVVLERGYIEIVPDTPFCRAQRTKRGRRAMRRVKQGGLEHTVEAETMKKCQCALKNTGSCSEKKKGLSRTSQSPDGVNLGIFCLRTHSHSGQSFRMKQSITPPLHESFRRLRPFMQLMPVKPLAHIFSIIICTQISFLSALATQLPCLTQHSDREKQRRHKG